MKFVIANWKLNPLTQLKAKELVVSSARSAQKMRNTRVVICPPFIWIPYVKSVLKKPIELGAQNAFWEAQGAFTGEVSPVMLKSVGCQWVILGHSERRNIFKENDSVINKKVKCALDTGLKVILAVGEQEREEEVHLVSAMLEMQVENALEGISKQKIKNVVIAYEPIWAIGTGKAETPQGALNAALLVRKIIGKKYGHSAAKNLKVLYGGSVTDKNVASFVNQDGIDGVLVGGASVNPKIFSKLLEALK